MARVVEALAEYTQEKGKEIAIFLAGGITNCHDWQTEIIEKFNDLGDVVLLNPRRADFPINDPLASQAQIEWEFHHLRRSDAILFWFPDETLCPISLYELGAWSMTTMPLFVGCHPEYRRSRDVSIQTRLVRPTVNTVYSLDDLAFEVRLWLKRVASKQSDKLLSDYEIMLKYGKTPEDAQWIATGLKERRYSQDRK